MTQNNGNPISGHRPQISGRSGFPPRRNESGPRGVIRTRRTARSRSAELPIRCYALVAQRSRRATLLCGGAGVGARFLCGNAVYNRNPAAAARRSPRCSVVVCYWGRPGSLLFNVAVFGSGLCPSAFSSAVHGLCGTAYPPHQSCASICHCILRCFMTSTGFFSTWLSLFQPTQQRLQIKFPSRHKYVQPLLAYLCFMTNHYHTCDIYNSVRAVLHVRKLQLQIYTSQHLQPTPLHLSCNS